MARKRPAAKEAPEQSFVQKLAQALIDNNHYIEAKVTPRPLPFDQQTKPSAAADG